jgi:hypothetical protein
VTQIKYLLIGLVVGLTAMWLMVGITSSNLSATVAGAEVSSPAAKPASAPTTTPATPAKLSPQATPPTGNALGNASVLDVNGEPITLRQIEDTLLSQEGVRQLMEMLDKQYSVMDWATLGDSDVIVQTATWRLTRVMLAAQLLKQKASDAREDLKNITLVRQALTKAGIVIDEAAIQNEVKRMEKRHYEALEAHKKPYMEFRALIQQTQKMPFNEYIHQEGFKMGAGIRILVEREARATLTDEQLQLYLSQHINDYVVQEAADISDIYIPFEKTKDASGAEVIAEEEKIRLYGVMQQLHKGIFSRKVTFERYFQLFGKVYEQHADPTGRLGFVNRDGTRPIKGSRAIDPQVMAEVFAVQPPYPVLLKPIASATGMDLILVHSKRAGKEPVFAELRDRLIADIVDAELPLRTKRAIENLNREAVIDYHSLPPLIEQRAKDAGLPTIEEPLAP